MITISEIVNWQDMDGCQDDRSVIPELAVPVGDSLRAAHFYERVFGFYRVFAAREVDSGRLVRATTKGARLALHPAPSPRAKLLRRWAFVVENLDDARARAWDLGVRIARDSGAPDHIYRRLDGGSLYVHDRDGNEIELVELPPGARVARASARDLASLEHAQAARAFR
jgi:catechol 2,3-dioxygenase-like lactoylglutathione lyase family enzyme